MQFPLLYSVPLLYNAALRLSICQSQKNTNQYSKEGRIWLKKALP